MLKKIFFSLFIFSFLMLPIIVLAAGSHCAGGTSCTATTETSCKAITGCAWVVEAAFVDTCPPGSVCLANPLGSVSTPQALIGRVINSILGVVGSIALLMFVYGGLTWMTSSGSQEKIKKGRDIIVWSAIGLTVIFLAYALTRVILTAIAE